MSLESSSNMKDFNCRDSPLSPKIIWIITIKCLSSEKFFYIVHYSLILRHKVAEAAVFF